MGHFEFFYIKSYAETTKVIDVKNTSKIIPTHIKNSRKSMFLKTCIFLVDSRKRSFLQKQKSKYLSKNIFQTFYENF